MEETISIIVPVFNAQAYLRTCIDSLLAQTYGSLELLLVNDGSTDVSGAILDEYAKRDSRVVVLQQTNRGVSAARNLGLNRATGAWVTFVDADDWVDTDHVERLLRAAQQENCDCVICGYIQEYPATSHVRHVGIEQPLTGEQAVFHMLRPDHYQGFLWNKLFRTPLIQSNSLRLDESLFYLEDVAFCAAYFSRCRQVHCIEHIGYHYRQHENSAIRSRADDLDWATKRLTAIAALEQVENLCTDISTQRLCAARQAVEHTQILRYLLTDAGRSQLTAQLLINARSRVADVVTASLPLKEKIKFISTVLFPDVMAAVWVKRERRSFRGTES